MGGLVLGLRPPKQSTYGGSTGIGSTPLLDTNSLATGSLTPVATTNNQSSSGNRNTNSTTNSRTHTNSVAATAFDKQNTTDSALAALEQIIGAGGNNQLLSEQETGKRKQQTQLEQLITSLSSGDIREQASGRTADLSRNLREQVLPEIFGGAEMAGMGGDALSQLLAQDAAIRTGEAQSRVEEEVRNNTQNQALQANQLLSALLDSGSGSMDALLAALSTAKGSVEQGSSVTTEDSNSTTNSTTTNAEDTNASSSSATIDPLAWAKLQAQLNANQGASGPDKGELAVALFNASKGPFQSLGDIGNPYDLGGTRANVSGDYGSNALYNAIYSRI